ncbi:MAG: helix-turn-helix transcriptional regulator [Cyclobacteriaceae bacterium]
MNNDPIGVLDELVLLTVCVLDSDSYAYKIKKEIVQETSRSFSLASIHTILYRLENRGMLSSRMGGQTQQRGGRSKRLFSLTSKGISTIKDIQLARQALWNRIQTI